MRVLNRSAFFAAIGYEPHPNQLLVHESDARFRIVVAGRRFGKTLLAAVECMVELIPPDKVVLVCAPVYAQAKIIYQEVLWRLRRYLMRWVLRVNEADLTIQLRNGSVLHCRSADNPTSILGLGADFLVMDEASRISEEVWTQALRPTLTDRKGSALFISTPAGMNWFYALFARGREQLAFEYQSWQFRTVDNPRIDPDEVENARRTLPERVFKQEYLAEFQTDGGEVFRGVDQCVCGKLENPEEGARYVTGVDLAKHQDYTVITTLKQTETGWQVVGFMRFTRIDWNLQKQFIIGTVNTYRSACIIDSTGVGDVIYDDLVRSDLNVKALQISSNSIKARLVENLAVAIETGAVKFPNIPELIDELKAYTYKTSDSGRTLYNAPSSFHDDAVMSLALAWKQTETQPMLSARVPLERRPMTTIEWEQHIRKYYTKTVTIPIR